MHTDEYRDTQDRLLMAALGLASLPLEEFIAAIDRAERVGPMLDPTLHRAAANRLAQVRAVAGGAQGIVRVLKSDAGLVRLAGEAMCRSSEGDPDVADSNDVPSAADAAS